MTDAERLAADHKLADALMNGTATKDQMRAAGKRIVFLNDEVERYLSAYRIAWDQAMMNGQAARRI